MKPKIWVLLFAVDAALHLLTTVSQLPTLNLITKPLLMVFLGGYFVSLVGSRNKSLKLIILAALLGSWFGDTFLMFQQHNSIFFILGLASFLIAHIGYIIAFRKFKRVIDNLSVYVIIILTGAYTFGLMYLLWPGLGDMKIPVILYAIVLTIMGSVGLIQNINVNIAIVVGVVLFIISDSLIAYTKFVSAIEHSRFLIMFTYILAQFLLIKGLSNRIIKIYS